VAADEQELRQGPVAFQAASQKEIDLQRDPWRPLLSQYPRRRGYWREEKAVRFDFRVEVQDTKPDPFILRIEQAARQSFWISYIGHGGPGAWGVQDRPESGPVFNVREVARFTNSRNLPIVFAVACQTGQLAPEVPYLPYRDRFGKVRRYQTLDKALRDVTEPNKPVTYKLLFVPVEPNVYCDVSNRCFATAWLVGSDRGGAIAYFGDARVHPADKEAKVEADMFRGYSRGMRVLGDLWHYGQLNYWQDHRLDQDLHRSARVYLCVLHLFGDPSLRLNR
jgi:hypothetical protein